MNSPFRTSFRLSEIVKDRGISQKTISKESGLPQKTVSLILTGKSVPNLDRLCRIADAVGVRIVFDCDCG